MESFTFSTNNMRQKESVRRELSDGRRKRFRYNAEHNRPPITGLRLYQMCLKRSRTAITLYKNNYWNTAVTPIEIILPATFDNEFPMKRGSIIFKTTTIGVRVNTIRSIKPLQGQKPLSYRRRRLRKRSQVLRETYFDKINTVTGCFEKYF